MFFVNLPIKTNLHIISFSRSSKQNSHSIIDNNQSQTEHDFARIYYITLEGKIVLKKRERKRKKGQG